MTIFPAVHRKDLEWRCLGMLRVRKKSNFVGFLNGLPERAVEVRGLRHRGFGAVGWKN